MSMLSAEPLVSAAARRPRVAKATSRQAAPKPRKVSFYLSDSAIRKLGVAAAMEASDKSSLVERLIQEGLRRYVVSDRAKLADPPADEGSAS